MRSLTEQEIIEFSALLPGVDVDGITHSDLIKRIDQIENLQAKLKRERQAISELIDRKRNRYPRQEE